MTVLCRFFTSVSQFSTYTVHPEKNETEIYFVMSIKLGRSRWNLVHSFWNEFAVKHHQNHPSFIENVTKTFWSFFSRTQCIIYFLSCHLITTAISMFLQLLWPFIMAFPVLCAILQYYQHNYTSVIANICSQRYGRLSPPCWLIELIKYY